MTELALPPSPEEFVDGVGPGHARQVQASSTRLADQDTSTALIGQLPVLLPVDLLKVTGGGGGGGHAAKETEPVPRARTAFG